MPTPFFPAWRPCLAPLGRRSAGLPRAIRQAALAQIEQHFAPVTTPDLLQQNPAQAYSRERVFTLARTFWCWIWQVLQANTSCREVVRQVQALFAITRSKVSYSVVCPLMPTLLQRSSWCLRTPSVEICER